ncbi:MAG: Cof-type HAD-IIB family hydrolase [Bacillota bacterium]
MDSEERKALSRIRLVAMDLDGTLLRRDGTVSPYTRSMVRKASRAGIEMVLATGRTSATAERLGRLLGLGGPFICSNGAHVLSIAPRADWQFIPIPADVLPGILAVLRGFGVRFEAAVKGAVVFEGQVSVRRPLLEMLRARIHGTQRIIPVGGTEKLAGKVVKVFTGATADLVSKVTSAGEEAFPGRLRYITTTTSSGQSILEIQDASVNKGQALGLVAERLGLSMDETAAIGDGDNDVEMLEAAGLGVAMANASPKLTMAADRFALSCEQDGVGYFLKELLEAQSA